MRQDDPAWPGGVSGGVSGGASGGAPVAEALPRGRRHLRARRLRQRRKLADILDALARDEAAERVSVADLMRAMDGNRAFGALLLVFAIPNALPAIPGTSGILGLPLLFLAMQMMLGRPPWLPRVVAERSVARADFARLVERVNPWLHWADKLTAPRFQPLVHPLAQRLIGLFCLALSLVLVLPVPFANMAPAAAICLIALGVLERDGLWILGGVVAGIGALLLASTVIGFLAVAAMTFFQNVWGFVQNLF